jgi:hypothetical protein
LKNHINVKGYNQFKDRWIKKMAKRNITPSYYIVTYFANAILAGEAEKELISFCRIIGIKLCNIANGGHQPAHYFGEDVHNAKLTRSKVSEIRIKYFDEKQTRKQLAQEYGVSISLIRVICHYKGWIDDVTIPENLSQLLKERAEVGIKKEYVNVSFTDEVNKKKGKIGEKNASSVLTEKDVLDIRNKYASGKYSYSELGKVFSVERSTIASIVCGKTWKHLLPANYTKPQQKIVKGFCIKSINS